MHLSWSHSTALQRWDHHLNQHAATWPSSDAAIGTLNQMHNHLSRVTLGGDLDANVQGARVAGVRGVGLRRTVAVLRQ